MNAARAAMVLKCFFDSKLENKESTTKYSVYLKGGNATEFYQILNPSWNGVYQYTKGAFSTTSFTTATGTKVILNTTSSSTGVASIKLIGKDNVQVLLRFTKP